MKRGLHRLLNRLLLPSSNFFEPVVLSELPKGDQVYSRSDTFLMLKTHDPLVRYWYSLSEIKHLVSIYPEASFKIGLFRGQAIFVEPPLTVHSSVSQSLASCPERDKSVLWIIEVATVNNENTVDVVRFCTNWQEQQSGTCRAAQEWSFIKSCWCLGSISVHSDGVVSKGGDEGGLPVPKGSRNGNRSWPSYMSCGVRADFGWLLVFDGPRWPTTLMDDAERERWMEHYMPLSRPARKARYKAWKRKNEKRASG